MAIPIPIRQNFQTLLRAAEVGHLALLECTDAKTGEPRYVICAIASNAGFHDITPFGHMSTSENPYEDYIPPSV